jgi:sulfatase modifying factor 1
VTVPRFVVPAALVASVACGGLTVATKATPTDSGFDAISEHSVRDALPEVGASLDATTEGSMGDDASGGTDSNFDGEGVIVDGGPPPSCAPGGPGMASCGLDAESCCTSLEVVGGTYYRTYDLAHADNGDLMFTDAGSVEFTLSIDGGATRVADPATISSLRLDKYDVTVGRFRQFVNAVLPSDGGAGWLPAAGSGKHTHLNNGKGLLSTGGVYYEPGWDASDDGNIAPTNSNLACEAPFYTWTPSASTQENLPINCITWQEAYAFCIWDGGFLPSEAEWEYAAAGGSQQRQYPWGSTAPGRANQYAIYGAQQPSSFCYYPTGMLASCTGVSNIAPVGTAALGAGLFGQLDLAGDLWQWNLDAYGPYTPCTDCVNLAGNSSSGEVIRGGAFFYDASRLLPPYRNFTSPSNRVSIVGFRCARTP